MKWVCEAKASFWLNLKGWRAETGGWTAYLSLSLLMKQSAALRFEAWDEALSFTVVLEISVVSTEATVRGCFRCARQSNPLHLKIALTTVFSNITVELIVTVSNDLVTRDSLGLARTRVLIFSPNQISQRVRSLPSVERLLSASAMLAAMHDKI